MKNPINRVEINIPLCLIVSGTLIVCLALIFDTASETVRTTVTQVGGTAIGGASGMGVANRKRKDNTEEE